MYYMDAAMDKYVKWLDKYKKLIGLIGIAFVIGFTIYGYTQGIFTDEDKMAAFLKQCGLLAPIIFTVIQAVQVVIPILPGAIGCVFGVVFFGPVWGFVYNYIGICIGSIWAFLIARCYGQEFVKKITGGKFYQKYSKHLINEKQFEKLFAILIFLPVAPDDFLCYLAGVSQITLKKFTAIILLGKPAAIFLYSLGLNMIFEYIIQILK